MLTTLDIDDSVLNAAKDLARRQGRTTSDVVSELLRRELSQPASAVSESSGRYGFRPFPAAPTEDRLTNDQVNRLRDQLSI